MLGGVLDHQKTRAPLFKITARLLDAGRPENLIPFTTDLLIAAPTFADTNGPDMLLCLNDFEDLIINNKLAVPDIPVYSSAQMKNLSLSRV